MEFDSSFMPINAPQPTSELNSIRVLFYLLPRGEYLILHLSLLYVALAK
jgi:hypothetical protein